MIATVLCIGFVGGRARSSESLQGGHVPVDVVLILKTKHSMDDLNTHALHVIIHPTDSAGTLRSQHARVSGWDHGHAYLIAP